MMRSENQGYRSYFKGNGVNVLKNVPESALKLAVNDRGQRTVLAREREKTTESLPSETHTTSLAVGRVRLAHFDHTRVSSAQREALNLPDCK